MKRSGRILVVDDLRICGIGTCLEVNSLGYESQAVADGFSALHMLNEGAWDIVLCDLHMPGMNGLEVVRETKRLFPDIFVILMTAAATDDDIQACIDAGAMGCLRKPFGATDLARCLDVVFETHGVRRA